MGPLGTRWQPLSTAELAEDVVVVRDLQFRVPRLEFLRSCQERSVRTPEVAQVALADVVGDLALPALGAKRSQFCRQACCSINVQVPKVPSVFPKVVLQIVARAV